MRELEFRGWDKKHKGMYPNIYFDNLEVWLWNPDGNELEVLGDRNPNGILIHIEIMQYTGIKDKNGIKVFEDDIVSEGGLIGLVSYSNEYAKFEYTTPTIQVGLYGFFGEIIGNIHENPGLLG